MISEKLIERMQKAYSITVLTGAGVSAESGIPTFRGKDGLWNKYNPQVLASPQAFEENPALVWEWYLWRRELIKKAKPNLGHYALVDLESFYEDFYIITQNVDGLHQRAGSKKVIELHGNIFNTRCFNCGASISKAVVNHEDIPLCEVCGGKARPGVVWFGESLPEIALEEAQQAAMECEIIFVVGTSALVEPAASLPSISKGNGSYVVEVNPNPTPISDWADESIQLPSASYLPMLVIELEKVRKRKR